ncbi:glycosyltransferase family 4 protein [Magnetovibrio sp. PR-2]|uniref:glycosyltransferase family 4 protein n=1 Tax=Magnetovibrio sp. PR-2 TaxID=3120356 RepID=UPI002FCE2F2B
MLNAVAALCVVVPLYILGKEIRTRPIHQVVLSPFWYFTFILCVAFPIRAMMIDADLIIIQALGHAQDEKPTSVMLASALIFVLGLWGAALTGRHSILKSFAVSDDETKPHNSPAQETGREHKRLLIGFGIMALVCIIVLVVLGERAITDFNGAAYQKSRLGAGPLLMIPELFTYAVLILLGWLIAYRARPIRSIEYLVIAVGLGLTVWVSIDLFSRRFIAAALLGMVILLVVKRKAWWPVGLMVFLSSIVATGILEFLRQLFYLSNSQYSFASPKELIEHVFIKNFAMFISSSYEGVEHLARFMDKASWLQLLTGVDHGTSWVFNAGLSLVPRMVWETKPVIYGGFAQFHWLYPAAFKDGFATAGIPMSFAVDFSFGFGLVFAALLTFLLGRLLGICERHFWSGQATPMQIVISLFILIYMFNWVRGGSIIVQSLLLFSIPCVMMFGFQSVLKTMFDLVAETTGVMGGAAAIGRKVFFYPHAYLRDRQMDTVRSWPEEGVENPDLVTARTGGQVTREQALKPAGQSWKTRLPLINLKRRPDQAPCGSTVYVWGGLITHGPFISDIDNPYAYTAYNPMALKLYKPILSAILEHPRCQEIRCLSQACRASLGREFGAAVLNKATVQYPCGSLTVAHPKTADPDRCRFVFISTQFEIKGGEALLRAFLRVVADHPHCTLDMVTHIPEHLAELAENIPNVTIHPAQYSREEIRERFLQNVDVLVHPTYFDSFGMVVLEALFEALPIIATDVYAIGEMVHDGDNGFLLEPPVSIWDKDRPSKLFSDIHQVHAALSQIDTTGFENALVAALSECAQAPEFRTRASLRSSKIAAEMAKQNP